MKNFIIGCTVGIVILRSASVLVVFPLMTGAPMIAATPK